MCMLVILHLGKSQLAALNVLRLSVQNPRLPRLREALVVEEEEECHHVLGLPVGEEELDSSSGVNGSSSIYISQISSF